MVNDLQPGFLKTSISYLKVLYNNTLVTIAESQKHLSLVRDTELSS